MTVLPSSPFSPALDDPPTLLSPFRFAHVSDTHLWDPSVTLRTHGRSIFSTKRLVGFLNVRLFRGPSVFSERLFRFALRDLVRLRVRHVVHTGDIVNICLEGEFELARNIFREEWIEKCLGEFSEGEKEGEGEEESGNDGEVGVVVVEEEEEEETEEGIMVDSELPSSSSEVSSYLTLVPGNHDLYVQMDECYFLKYFGDTLSIWPRSSVPPFSEAQGEEEEEEEEGEEAVPEDGDASDAARFSTRNLDRLFPQFKILGGGDDEQSHGSRVLLVMLNTSYPRSLVASGGRLFEQIERANAILLLATEAREQAHDGESSEVPVELHDDDVVSIQVEMLRRVDLESLCVIVVMHHCPAHVFLIEPLERLYNIPSAGRNAFLAFCRDWNVSAAIHGHLHHSTFRHVELPPREPGEEAGRLMPVIDAGTCNHSRGATVHIYTVEGSDLRSVEVRSWSGEEESFVTSQVVMIDELLEERSKKTSQDEVQVE